MSLHDYLDGMEKMLTRVLPEEIRVEVERQRYVLTVWLDLTERLENDGKTTWDLLVRAAIRWPKLQQALASDAAQAAYKMPAHPSSSLQQTLAALLTYANGKDTIGRMTLAAVAACIEADNEGRSIGLALIDEMACQMADYNAIRCGMTMEEH